MHVNDNENDICESNSSNNNNDADTFRILPQEKT